MDSGSSERLNGITGVGDSASPAGVSPRGWAARPAGGSERSAGIGSTLVVLALLAAVGFAGHKTGWRLPSFAQLRGVASGLPDDWCADHCVPGSQCVECRADEFPPGKDFGWCESHGVHQCPLDHPEVAQLKSPAANDERRMIRAERALSLRPRPENNSACTSYRRRIQFASHDAALKAGVDVEPVVTGPVVEAITASGELRYDSTQVAPLSAKAAGTVWRVYKQVGDRVREGELVALVDAAEVGRIKAEMMAALAERDLHDAQLRRLKSIDIPARQIYETETELRKARTRILAAQQALINLGLSMPLDQLHDLSEIELAKRIRLLGLPPDVADSIDSETASSNLMPIVSRIDGIVVQRSVVPDQVVDTSTVLLTVADTSRLWLILNVPFEEASLVATGQPVAFRPDGSAAEVTGEVQWVSTAVDPVTRTVEVRADIENSTGSFRAETFGTGRIVLREEPEAVLVPSEAVQWDGSCFVVFVRDKDYFDEAAPKVFHTRSVRPGVRSRQVTEVIAGLVPNEVVATRGSGVLRAQLLRNNLGAG